VAPHDRFAPRERPEALHRFHIAGTGFCVTARGCGPVIPAGVLAALRQR